MRHPVYIPGRRLKFLSILLILGVMGILLLSVFWQGTAVVLNHLNKNYIVVIDAGHGGYDPGAITKQGLYEKEINLQMAKRVRELLKPTGIEIVLTRDEDIDYVPNGVRGKTTKKQVDLNYRIAMAQKVKADIFVSLHVNAADTSRKSGAETFYHYNSELGKTLAENIQQELIKVSGMNKRVAKPAAFYIIKNTAMPAVLVELGYISNKSEREKLQQPWYQEQLANAIAKGIARYFNLP